MMMDLGHQYISTHNDSLRVVYVIGDLGGCGFYRCVVPGFALRNRGHSTFFTKHLLVPPLYPEIGTPKDHIRQLANAIRDANVVVFQRQTSPAVLEDMRIMRKQFPHLRFVLEFDDNFHLIPPENPHAKYYGPDSADTKILEQFLREVDAVTVSTPQLATYYKRFNENIHVCYNAIPDDIVERHLPVITGLRKRPGELRLGWAGTNTHESDIRLMVPVICRLMDETPDLKMVWVGWDWTGMFPEKYRSRCEFAGLTVITHELTINDIGPNLPSVQYIDLIKRADFDIVIAPIEPHPFNQSKSYLKLFEYALTGAPAVASDFGPYRQYVDECIAENGYAPALLASNLVQRAMHIRYAGRWRQQQRMAPQQYERLSDRAQNEWVSQIRSLIRNPEIRATLAKRNLHYLLGKHLVSKRAPLWEGAYRAALASR